MRRWSLVAARSETGDGGEVTAVQEKDDVEELGVLRLNLRGEGDEGLR